MFAAPPELPPPQSLCHRSSTSRIVQPLEIFLRSCALANKIAIRLEASDIKPVDCTKSDRFGLPLTV